MAECAKKCTRAVGWAGLGGFHKPIYAVRRTFTPKIASQKLCAEHKMALRPTFSLHEIDP